MNKRIQELAEQAKDYARKHVEECRHYDHYMEHNEYELRFEEKFAELIVKECMMVAVECDVTEYGDFRGGISEEIKRHFGVEP